MLFLAKNISKNIIQKLNCIYIRYAFVIAKAFCDWQVFFLFSKILCKKWKIIIDKFFTLENCTF